MMQETDVLIAFIVGAALGALGIGALLGRRRREDQLQLANAEARAELLESQLGELARLREENQELTVGASRLETQLAGLKEQVADRQAVLEESRRVLTDTFKALGVDALHQNNRQFLSLASSTFETLLAKTRGEVDERKQAIEHMVKPIRELMDKQHKTLIDFDRRRAEERSGLEQHLRLITDAHEKLGAETQKLVTALRRPDQRGRWGEMQLRNVVEMAGMTRHCDFSEQVHASDEERRYRPDMTINLPGGGVIIVDAKVPLDAYLDALQPDADRDALMARHTQHVERHVRELSSKRYWSQFEGSVKSVVMFVPLEAALVAALEDKPGLQADAMKAHVLITTPTLLIAMLRAIAYGWQQEALAENAREISKAGGELYDRLARFVTNLEKVGASIDGAATAYNKAVGSLEKRVLPSSRELKRLHATNEAEIEAPPSAKVEIRAVMAAELKPQTREPAENK